jgi:hypothetical protein
VGLIFLILLVTFIVGVCIMATGQKCPFCIKWINHAATKCPHCQSDLRKYQIAELKQRIAENEAFVKRQAQKPRHKPEPNQGQWAAFCELDLFARTLIAGIPTALLVIMSPAGSNTRIAMLLVAGILVALWGLSCMCQPVRKPTDQPTAKIS